MFYTTSIVTVQNYDDKHLKINIMFSAVDTWWNISIF